ncbi:hypothetical protein ACFQQB_52555 [Nonomuraea rubra]
MSENELGAYLRSRREAVKPSDVGLPDGGRRRTPGCAGRSWPRWRG